MQQQQKRRRKKTDVRKKIEELTLKLPLNRIKTEHQYTYVHNKHYA